jgi:hypothetical protein
MRIANVLPVLRPLKAYPRVLSFITSRITDTWPTADRLASLASVSPSLHLTLLHARNDGSIDFRHSEAVYAALERVVLAREGARAVEERRSLLGGERVRRGAFAFKTVESAEGDVRVELEVLRYGGHNDVLGFSAVGLAVRRAFAGEK